MKFIKHIIIFIIFLIPLLFAIAYAFNPVQYLAKKRDVEKVAVLTEVGKAINAYAAANDGVYPLVGVSDTNTGCPGATSWVDCLVVANRIHAVPNVNINYDLNDNGAIVYATYEADSNQVNCDVMGGEIAYVVYSTSHDRIGGFCGVAGAEPTAAGLGSTDTFNF